MNISTSQISPCSLIDSHAHLDFVDFDHDRDEIFKSMRELGIESVVIPGVSEKHWQRQMEIAAKYDCPFALGIHPWFCDDNTAKSLGTLRRLLQANISNPKLVAIGESGLDKLHKSNWATQLHAFDVQIEFAQEFELPLILHAVNAHQEVLERLRLVSLPKRGVIHGFYGGPILAKEYVRLGYKLGIGGLILNENARKLQETVAQLPIDSFLLETDSPSMTPKNAAKTRNTPLVLPSILEKIVNLQKKSDVLISERLLMNVTQLFDL